MKCAGDKGAPLDANTRAFMEPHFRYDFSQVRVHTNEEADNLSRSISAVAFTIGRHIFFRQRSYEPGSPSGQQLLAHELAHVVQQRDMSRSEPVTIGPPHDGYEREADAAAAIALTDDIGASSAAAVLPTRFLLSLSASPQGVARRKPDDKPRSAEGLGEVHGVEATVPAAASKGKRYTKNPQPKKHEYKDCHDAARQLSHEKDIGTTAPHLRYHGKSPQVTISPDGSYKAEMRLTWQVDPDRTIVTMPEISWPNMTDAERSAVKDAMDALLGHEEGHVKVAEDYTRELSGERLSASGSSPEAAKAALMRQLAEHEKAVKTKLDERGNDYDDRTDHGRHQSRLGGKDAVVICPPS